MISKLLPILCILLAVGLFFGYIEPTYTGQIADANQQIASYNSALTAATQFTQKENQLLAEENQIPAASIQRLESYLPDGVNNVQLILDLNSLASRSGIALSNFSVSNNSNNATAGDTTSAGSDGSTVPALNGSTPTNSLDLSVNATGTYNAFRTFLAASEQSLRTLDVTSLSLTDSASGVYTYQMTFRIYWLP